MFSEQQRRQREAAMQAVEEQLAHSDHMYLPPQDPLPAYPQVAPAYSAAPPPGYDEAISPGAEGPAAEAVPLTADTTAAPPPDGPPPTF
mmetsp:Transcript_11038/g.32989  ORF Transcript_11038/g.32989 Transcript_11038/m.32989 type:complete len:89 (+) Transcript_11038:341-607(+)